MTGLAPSHGTAARFTSVRAVDIMPTAVEFSGSRESRGLAMSENDKIPTRWCDRSSCQYMLRAAGGTSRVLMMRYADGEGLDSDGRESVWRDIATFPSYNDADSVLRKLRS